MATCEREGCRVLLICSPTIAAGFLLSESSEWAPKPEPQDKERQIAFHQIMEFLIGWTPASELWCCSPGFLQPLKAWQVYLT